MPKQQVKNYSRKMVSGFSLVELLVGLMVGLLVSLVIMQVFSTFEGEKRSSMGSADAQTNGNIALYSLSRDLQQAGWGLPVLEKTFSGLNCLTPVTITDGGGGATDSITIRYGDSEFGGFSKDLTAVDGGTRRVTMSNSLGCQVGDAALVFNAASCFNRTVQAISSATQVQLNDVTGVVAPGFKMSCLGTWVVRDYAVNANNQLAINAGATPVAADIVNIQAQYGVSATPDSSIITAWVNATGIWTQANLAGSVTNRNRIKAVRVAVVARNGLREKTNVTQATCTTIKGTVSNGPCAWDDASVPNAAPSIDISGLPDWRNYRYRVYETIVPIRNMVWPEANLT